MVIVTLQSDRGSGSGSRAGVVEVRYRSGGRQRVEDIAPERAGQLVRGLVRGASASDVIQRWMSGGLDAHK